MTRRNLKQQGQGQGQAHKTETISRFTHANVAQGLVIFSVLQQF
jgi:hypothetical protein